MLEDVPSEKKLQDVLSKSKEIHSLAKTSEKAPLWQHTCH